MKGKKNNKPISGSIAALATLLSKRISGPKAIPKANNKRIRNRRRVEIDRNEGGRKQNTQNLKTIRVNVDGFTNAIATRPDTSSDFNWRYTINGQTAAYNVTQSFLGNPELQYWQAISSEIKVHSIGMTINYSRQPVSGEIWPKWYFIYQTEKIQYKVEDLKNNPSTMTLDMNFPGNKVYRMMFNSQNIDKSDLEWQQAENLHLPRVDITYDNSYARILTQNTLAAQEVIGQAHFYLTIICKVPEFKNLANSMLQTQKIALRNLPIYQNLSNPGKLQVEKIANKMSDKEEVRRIIREKKITKDEAVKLVKRWDQLSSDEDEC